MVTQKCCPVLSTSVPAKFEVAMSNCLEDVFTRKLHYLTFGFDLAVKVTGAFGQYPYHHVTYAPAKFEVDLSNSLGGDIFTRKYII